MTAGRAERFVVVGQVRRPHGVRGEVSVDVESDIPGRFTPGVTMSLLARGGGRRAVEIASVRAHGGRLLVHFVGVDDRDEAAKLRGCALQIEAEVVPPAPQGSYYYYQLVGCRCRDGRAGEIGKVEEVIEDGGGLLLSVTTDGNSLLIPFVADFIRLIDVEEKTIELDLPEGLLELCVSPS